MKPTSPPELRRLVYTLLIAIAVAAVVGRIASVERLYEPSLSLSPAEVEAGVQSERGKWPSIRPDPMPTHGSNDRSRWDTVRALVEDGTYAIGRRDPDAVTPTNPYGDAGLIADEGWKTVDKVFKDGKFYSSKPPLLPTLAAAEYWVLKRYLGWHMVVRRWLVVRVILLTFNALPFLGYLALIALLAERFGASDWGRIFVVAAAAFGTLVTPFLNTFNNHTVAACAAAAALYAAVRAAERPGWTWFALTGLAAGFTTANELPAAALAAALLVFLLRRNVVWTLAAFLPALLLPIAALLWTNYLALGQWTPAYGEFGSPWYEYPGSHWAKVPGEVKHGIDWAAYNGEPKTVYAFHMLLGHHGLFSLTPVFLLSFIGMIAASGRCLRDFRARTLTPFNELAAWSLTVSVVVVAFYIRHPSANYGGWTAGMRWFIWLTPLWLMALIPAADFLAPRRWGRWLGLLLLAVSVFSATYPEANPWRHPWLYNWLESLGYVHY
jgi:hypothetical protein